MANKKLQSKPEKNSDPRVAQLFAALQNGISRDRACRLANIHRSTFYRWMEKDEEFATQVLRVEALPNYFAHRAIMSAIVGVPAEYKVMVKNGKEMLVKIRSEIKQNPRVVMWFLEKREPERYGKNPIGDRQYREQERLITPKDPEACREMITKLYWRNCADSDPRLKHLLKKVKALHP